MRLEEGRSYKFMPVKIITLPDSVDNLVISGPDGRKYLLPLSYYTGYNLENKKEIVCKVDKINCSGKVFLEPENPFYNEGEFYDFNIDESLSAENKDSFFVTDVLGNKIAVPIRMLKNTSAQEKTVTLKIEKISKGRLHFSRPHPKDDVEDLIEGEYYEFTVKGIETDAEGDKNYIVTDVNNKKHRLPVRYYGHYGFKTGESFRGRIIRYSAGSPKSIEPENPWYAPGDIVEVSVGTCMPDETGIHFIADVYDSNGFNYRVKCTKKPVTQVLKCSVLKIRKGRPVLVPLEDQ